MARNYKRDRMGRFARVNSLSGSRKRNALIGAAAGGYVGAHAGVLGVVPGAAAGAALGSRVGARKQPVRRATPPGVRQRAQSAAAKEQAFWDRELGPGAVRVTAGTTTTGVLRKKVIPSIKVSPTSSVNARKMQNWNAKKLKQAGA